MELKDLIDVIDPKDLIMRKHIGDGKTPDGVKFEIVAAIPNNAPMIDFKENGGKYALNLEKFVMACDEMRKEAIKK